MPNYSRLMDDGAGIPDSESDLDTVKAFFNKHAFKLGGADVVSIVLDFRGTLDGRNGRLVNLCFSDLFNLSAACEDVLRRPLCQFKVYSGNTKTDIKKQDVNFVSLLSGHDDDWHIDKCDTEKLRVAEPHLYVDDDSSKRSNIDMCFYKRVAAEELKIMAPELTETQKALTAYSRLNAAEKVEALGKWMHLSDDEINQIKPAAIDRLSL